MSAGANEKLGFLRQVDILVMFGALVALFVALGSEPWWTLTGTATSSLLSVQVSPFYLHINALGLPPTVSAANNLGSFTRVLLILGSLALFAASIQPTSWWRNHDVYLSPPYQHVWFSSNDKEFNPLGKDPEVLNDDELLVSFQKLFDTVEPGGSLSIILPDWATTLGDRIEKLMPITGFEVESSGLVYRVPGRPENQLRFRKPVQEQSASPIVKPAIEEPAPVSPLLPPAMPAEKALDLEPPRVLEIAQTPAWRNARMTRPERAILKSAVTTITARQEAVPYRELLNQVYMELVDKKVDFDSARQIETTLLNHNGREILLIEEADETGTRVLQKWWLGEQQVAPEKARRLPFLGKIARSRPKLPRPQGLLTRFQKPRYEHHGTDDGDSDSEQPSS